MVGVMWEQEHKLAAMKGSDKYTCYSVGTLVPTFVSVNHQIFTVSEVANSVSPTRTVIHYCDRTPCEYRESQISVLNCQGISRLNINNVTDTFA